MSIRSRVGLLTRIVKCPLYGIVKLKQKPVRMNTLEYTDWTDVMLTETCLTESISTMLTLKYQILL